MIEKITEIMTQIKNSMPVQFLVNMYQWLPNDIKIFIWVVLILMLALAIKRVIIQ